MTNKNAEENEYEKHVKVLTEHLHEANKAAGQQSKHSHATAKRCYDRETKLERFKREVLYMSMTPYISAVRPESSHTNIKDYMKLRERFPH